MDVLGYYKGKPVLEHYLEATRRVGMWASEELVFRQSFPDREASLLELGCGTGRICLSLWMAGYGNLTAIDFSKEMIHGLSRPKRKEPPVFVLPLKMPPVCPFPIKFSMG